MRGSTQVNCATKGSVRGFTIVELLIVVVVIAILAAITIVAYNGIQNRAKASAAQSAASQVSKRIQTFAIENADTYPASLTALGISNDGTTTYQYAVDNNTTPRYYCVTATTQNQSYYISSSSPSPSVGGCPGHGQNGVASVTNLAQNPSFEAGLSGIGINTNGSVGNNSVETSGGVSGNNFFRRTFSGSSSGASVGPYQQITGLSPDKTYYLRVSVRSNTPVNYRISAERRNAASQSVGTLQGQTVSIPGNSTWTEVTLEVPPTPNMERMTFCVYSTSGSWSDGNRVDFDGFFIAEGAGPYSYADGSTANWIWNGTPHASTSTGPAV